MVKFNTYIASDVLTEKWVQAPLKDRPGITAYLTSLDAGRAATTASNFFGDQTSPQQVLDIGIDVIRKSQEVAPRFAAYDLTRIEKYGPQGWIYPLASDDMINKIDAYFTRCNQPCKASEKALKMMLSWLSTAQLSPYSYDMVIKRGIDKTGLTSNSGFPLFSKRKKVLPETKSFAYDNGADLRYPATLGARSIKNKLRLIFMAPADQNLRELSYVYPLMDWLLANCSAVHGWQGQEIVETAINDTYDFSGKSTLLSTDFTAMDTTIGPAQVKVIADLVCAAFKPQFRDEIRSLLLQVPEQPIVVGSVIEPGSANQGGKRRRLMYISGIHGWISGLGWTNLGETLLQLLLDTELSFRLPIIAAEVNGDDGAKCIDGRKNLERVAAEFSRTAGRYGFESNVSKQFVSYDELHYLQRVYSPETVRAGRVRGAYPLILTLNSAKNPERSQFLTPSEKAVRIIMIFNNQCGSPYYREALKVMIAGMPSVTEVLSDMTQAGEAYEYLTGSGERISSINPTTRFKDLEIVQILRRDPTLFDESARDYGTVIA